MRIPSSRKLLVGAAVAFVAIVVLLFIGAGFGGDETDGTVPRPTTTLADCPVEVADAPDAWPLVLPAALQVTDYTVDGLTYVAEGISNDPERLLDQALEETLVDHDTSEPDGGDRDLVVGFESATSGGTFTMADPDGDECWSARFELTFLAEPTPDELFPTDTSAATGSGSDAADSGTADGDGASGGDGSAGTDGSDAAGGEGEPERLVDPAGTGSATTGRGTFALDVVECSLEPPQIVAEADGGRLEVTSTGPSDVALTWTYDDGTVVADPTSRATIASSTSGLIIADGENDEGPETIIVEIDCSAS